MMKENKHSLLLAGLFHETDSYVVKRATGRKDWLLIFTLAGEGYIETPNQEERCLPGTLSLLKPGIPHHYGTAKGRVWDFYWAHFSPLIMETFLLPNLELYTQKIDNSYIYQRIYDSFQKILADFIERSIYWKELCETSLREILILLAQRRNNNLDPRIEEALSYLSHHLSQKIEIESLAEKVGLSPSRLSHLFKENTGYAIIEMHNQMRIRQAALLLEHTNRQASEAAYEVGYHNYNHFAKQFQKIYGLNPSSFMKQRKQT